MSIKMIKSFGLALLLGLGSIAMAQETAAPAPADTDFSDAELQSFVEVQEELQSIRLDYTARLEETDDPAASAELQEEASQKMVEIVEGSDLDVDRYNMIAMALQQDDELMARVQALLEG